MPIKVGDYFEKSIMPVIYERHSDILSEMSIMILGSVGLGIDDKLSDLEAAIYLDDYIWKRSGGQLQLTMNDCLMKTNPWQNEGSVISVYPLSWLLDGQAKNFLKSTKDLPWEKVSFETLFNIQNNFIFYDPQGVLSRLREATDPSKLPNYLWKKNLLQKLNNFDLKDLKKSIMRNQMIEANILQGLVIEVLMQIGFLISHQYYPWRTHLRWAFEKLPLPISSYGYKIDALLTSEDWNKKVTIIDSIYSEFKDYMDDNAIIPEIDIKSSNLSDELVWAERLKAWETPAWRNWITKCTNKAIENGYEAYQFWVWSLWGWVNEELEGKVIK